MNFIQFVIFLIACYILLCITFISGVEFGKKQVKQNETKSDKEALDSYARLLAEIDEYEPLDDNPPLTPDDLVFRINKPVLVIVDDRQWWDIVEEVSYTDVDENNENCCYINLALFGNAHYKTFEFYDKE